LNFVKADIFVENHGSVSPTKRLLNLCGRSHCPKLTKLHYIYADLSENYVLSKKVLSRIQISGSQRLGTPCRPRQRKIPEFVAIDFTG